MQPCLRKARSVTHLLAVPIRQGAPPSWQALPPLLPGSSQPQHCLAMLLPSWQRPDQQMQHPHHLRAR